MEADHVFVYGSLKRGFRLYPHYLADCEFTGEGVLEGYTLHKVQGAWYPGIRKGDGGVVLGDVFKVDSRIVSLLDRVEDLGHLYDRVVEEIKMRSGGFVKAYVYVYIDKKNLGSIVEEGIWKELGHSE